jgi:hypothetical protein
MGYVRVRKARWVESVCVSDMSSLGGLEGVISPPLAKGCTVICPMMVRAGDGDAGRKCEHGLAECSIPGLRCDYSSRFGKRS